MAEIPKIVLPHGGYRKLIVFRKSDVVYEGTVAFCRRFLPKRGDRTVDQMTQAARSCKQNIAEGSASSGTSKETELKLTNVARATLDELMEDYHDYLKSNGLGEWPLQSEKAVFARTFAKEHNDWTDWKEIFETRPAETLANLMLTICNQTHYMLGKMIERQEADFRKLGGVRERMHAARTAARGEEFEKGLYSRLDAAATPEALARAVAELKVTLDRTARGIRKRKGWTALLAAVGLAAFSLSAAEIVDKVDFTPLGEEGHRQLPTSLVHTAVFRPAPVRKPGMTLVDGTNTLTIVTEWGGRKGLWALGKELQYHLEEMSGRKVALVEPRKRPAKGPLVVIGTDDGKVPEGTSIVRRTKPDELYIGGEGAGVSHALTYVLEALGCRYLFPGKEGKIIPKRARVVLPDFELNYTPELKVRLVKLPTVGNRRVNAGLKEKGIEPGDFAKAQKAATVDHPGNRGFWQWHGVNDETLVATATPPYSRVVRAGHHFDDYWDKYKDTHPEWFAMQPDGTRNMKPSHPRLCTSNKALRDNIVGECIGRIDRQPEMRGISICMPDGGYDSYCFCEDCRRLDPKNAPKRPGFLYKPAKHPYEYVALTDRMLNFANYVQAEVRRQRPGRHLVQFVYSNFKSPPLREIPDRDLIFFNVAGNYTDAKNFEAARKNLAAWLSFGNPVVWRPNCLAGFRCPYPMNFGRKLFSDIEACKANGAVGVSFDCGNAAYASRGFMFYMLAKAVLNPDRLSYGDIAADWVKSGFGPAARPMAEYLLALERVFDRAAERAIGARGYQEAFDADRFAALLDKAEAAAKGDAAIRARVDYLRVGIAYARASKGVYDGWKTGDWKTLGAARKVYAAWVREEGLRHAFEFPHNCPYMVGRPYRPALDGELKAAPGGEGFRKGETDDEGNVVE